MNNWEHTKLKNKETAFKHILQKFYEDRKTILKKGPSTADSFTISLGIDNDFIFTKNGVTREK